MVDTRMKVLIVYETGFGNTERIARSIGEALYEHGDVRVIPLGWIRELEEDHIDLLVFGAPTRPRGLSDESRELLLNPPDNFRGVRVLAFDTRYRGVRWVRGSAAAEIARLLRRLDCQLLAGPESFFVAGVEGPLEPGEAYRAKSWALAALGRTRPSAVGRSVARRWPATGEDGAHGTGDRLHRTHGPQHRGQPT